MKANEVLEHGADFYLPNLSVDMVIIGYQDNQLKCLLLRLGEKWLLPGGYIKKEESVGQAASRIMMERTRLQEPHLKFLSVFGESNRKFGDEFRAYFEKNGWPWKESYFINNRFVTLGFYSLVDIANSNPEAGQLVEEVRWFSFDDLPPMWLDHASIVNSAKEQLKKDIGAEQVTYNLLPQEFTMPELHRLHEAILEEKIDRSRFQKKMLASGIFKRLPKLQKDSRGSNPYQYKVNKQDN